MGTDAGRPGDAGGSDVFEGLTLDEDFVRGATVKEPSARAKMLAERWRHEPPAAQPFRAGPPVLQAPRGAGGRRTGRLLAGVVAALVVAGLVAVVVAPGRVESLLGLSAAPPAAAPVPDPAQPPALDPARPFAGSPAEAYAGGAAGIVLPAARRTGRFPAAEVTAALQQAKRYLVTSRLDPRVVSGGAVDPVLSMLDPLGPRREAEAALTRPTGTVDPGFWLTRFDPLGTQPVGSVVKVRGTVTYRAAARDELRVTTDHLFVYAVQRKDRPETARRVVVRVIGDFRAYHGKQATPGKVWTGTAYYSAAGAECGGGAFLQPSFGDRPPPSGRPGDPYQQDPVDTTAEDGSCDPVTRV